MSNELPLRTVSGSGHMISDIVEALHSNAEISRHECL